MAKNGGSIRSISFHFVEAQKRRKTLQSTVQILATCFSGPGGRVVSRVALQPRGSRLNSCSPQTFVSGEPVVLRFDTKKNRGKKTFAMLLLKGFNKLCLGT